MKRGGMSLVELLIFLMVFGVLIGLGLIVATPFLQRLRLEDARSEVYAAVTFARSDARRQSRHRELVASGATLTLNDVELDEKDRVTSRQTLRVFTLPHGARFEQPVAFAFRAPYGVVAPQPPEGAYRLALVRLNHWTAVDVVGALGKPVQRRVETR